MLLLLIQWVSHLSEFSIHFTSSDGDITARRNRKCGRRKNFTVDPTDDRNPTESYHFRMLNIASQLPLRL